MENMDPAEPQEIIAAVGAFNTAVQEAGAFVTDGCLRPPSTATTVDYSGDSPILTPRPVRRGRKRRRRHRMDQAGLTCPAKQGRGPRPPRRPRLTVWQVSCLPSAGPPGGPSGVKSA